MIILRHAWEIRHPGPVVAAGDDEGSAGYGRGLIHRCLSFTIFIIGHMLMSMRITGLEQRRKAQNHIDGGN